MVFFQLVGENAEPGSCQGEKEAGEGQTGFEDFSWD